MPSAIYRTIYQGEATINPAGTAGSIVFGGAIDELVITPTIGVFVGAANTLGTATTGTTTNGRYYVPSGVTRRLPWQGSIVYCVNFTAAQTGTVLAEGWVL